MAKLRHIALHTADPEKTAEFYKRVFDMVEVGRTDSPIAKGVYLSDGTINMAVLRFKTAAAADRHDGRLHRGLALVGPRHRRPQRPAGLPGRDGRRDRDRLSRSQLP